MRNLCFFFLLALGSVVKQAPAHCNAHHPLWVFCISHDGAGAVIRVGTGFCSGPNTTKRAVNHIQVTESFLLLTFEPAELSLALRCHTELAADS